MTIFNGVPFFWVEIGRNSLSKAIASASTDLIPVKK
jgi:hypothetical protein